MTKKNLFISWSGSRSKEVAEALNEWLPIIIQAVVPWISSHDIGKGERWLAEITSQLQEIRTGIFCLTSENLDAPWLHFEAGALSNAKDTQVCTILLDIKTTDVKQPLAQFNATTAERDDVRKLLGSINSQLGDRAIEDAVIEKQFEVWWPRLSEKLEKIKTMSPSTPPKRSEYDILEEILEIVRNLSQEGSSRYHIIPKSLLQAKRYDEILRYLAKANLSDELAEIEHVLPRRDEGAELKTASLPLLRNETLKLLESLSETEKVEQSKKELRKATTSGRRKNKSG